MAFHLKEKHNNGESECHLQYLDSLYCTCRSGLITQEGESLIDVIVFRVGSQSVHQSFRPDEASRAC